MTKAGITIFDTSARSAPGCRRAATPCTRDTLIEGFHHFVNSMTAPIASGGSDFAGWARPTGKRRLAAAPAGSLRDWHTLIDQAENPMRFVGRHVPDLLITITSLAQIRLLALRDHQREPDEVPWRWTQHALATDHPKTSKPLGTGGSGSLLAGRLIVPCTAALCGSADCNRPENEVANAVA